jgi:hypothetical protein
MELFDMFSGMLKKRLSKAMAKKINEQIKGVISSAIPITLSGLPDIQENGETNFVVSVEGDMEINACLLDFKGKKTTLIIRSSGDTVNTLTSTDEATPMFTVGEGVTLILENIRLKTKQAIPDGIINLNGGFLVLKENYSLSNFCYCTDGSTSLTDEPGFIGEEDVSSVFIDVIGGDAVCGVYFYGGNQSV